MEKNSNKPKYATPQEIEKIKEILLKHYPNSTTELNYEDIYQLAVAVMLSAQCTDKRVNIITPNFFKKYPTIYDLAKANVEDVKELIKSCSFFNNKAKNLVAMAKEVVEKYNGKFPTTQKELISLPGIGQKSANVILIEYLGKNLMAVDTHVFRVAHRLGLSYEKTPAKTEEELVSKFKDNLNRLHQAMVLFGRYICTAKNPKCDKCFLKEFCKSKENFKPS
ncbi:MAG: endonuclease III [Epsilonproteobacteria bacterium]|nr:endonuclease III [Campylobacterota bacterium]